MTKAFASAYVAQGFDAKAAYMQINPKVTPESAKTLGSKLLAKVDQAGAIEPLLTDTLNLWKQAASQAIALAQTWLGGDIQSQTRAMDYLIKFGQVLAHANPVPKSAKQINNYHLPKR